MRRLAEIPPLYVYIVSTLWGLALEFWDNAKKVCAFLRSFGKKSMALPKCLTHRGETFSGVIIGHEEDKQLISRKGGVWNSDMQYFFQTFGSNYLKNLSLKIHTVQKSEYWFVQIVIIYYKVAVSFIKTC